MMRRSIGAPGRSVHGDRGVHESCGPLLTNVRALMFRFVEPPRRQGGFIGIGARTRCYELEVRGAPSADRHVGSLVATKRVVLR